MFNHGCVEGKQYTFRILSTFLSIGVKHSVRILYYASVLQILLIEDLVAERSFHIPSYVHHLSINVKHFILDIDECAIGTHECDLNANCTNMNGAYNCSCNKGYDGDGFNCTGNYAVL